MSSAAPATAAPVNEPLLLRHDDGGIVTLTLNRPRQYNALSDALLGDLQSALDAIAGDAAARVVVIAGAGAAFCAGHDLRGCAPAPTRPTTATCSGAAAG
jgi:enoyl-CoA hydratase/carnithine racemase